FTVLLLLLFGFTGQWFIPAFLAIDFLMRSGRLAKFSLLGNSSKSIVKWLLLPAQLINAGPKIFAARIGFVFSAIILVSVISGFTWLALGFAAVLAFFSFMEAAFGFCVACEIYPYLYRYLYKNHSF
ncbi:MAG: DUF4395 domain-containing protein, partial [Mariniphaga sp.]|nr:DUF4395 domain-containing protein [Mariniphaga sp.]